MALTERNQFEERVSALSGEPVNVMKRTPSRWLNLGSAALLVAGVMTSEAVAQSPNPSCVPELYARTLAGPSAMSCGTAERRADTEAVIKCLLKAQTDGRAVRAKFVRAGIDSTVIDVFVRTDKGVSLVLHYDGDPSGGGGDANPRLGQQKCSRFERFNEFGPDVRCVDGVALPVLCGQRER